MSEREEYLSKGKSSPSEHLSEDAPEETEFTDILRDEWNCLSEEEKVFRLAGAYEAFAADAAKRLRHSHILPRWTSYHDILKMGRSEKSRLRVTRNRRNLLSLVNLLDERRIFYRDYLEAQFSDWRGSRPKEFYGITYRVPSAFPLVQHLLTEEALERYYRDQHVHRFVGEVRDREAEDFRSSERLVHSCMTKQPQQFPDVRSVLLDPLRAPLLSLRYIRSRPEFYDLLDEGQFAAVFGEENEMRLLEFAAANPFLPWVEQKG